MLSVKTKEKEGGEREGFLSSRSLTCWYWTHICGQRGQCSVTSECETHHTTILWKHDPVEVNRDALGWLLLGVNIVVSANKDWSITSSSTTAHPKSRLLPLTNKSLVHWHVLYRFSTSLWILWQQNSCYTERTDWQTFMSVRMYVKKRSPFSDACKLAFREWLVWEIIRWWDKAQICNTHTQDPIWLSLVWMLIWL